MNRVTQIGAEVAVFSSGTMSRVTSANVEAATYATSTLVHLTHLNAEMSAYAVSTNVRVTALNVEYAWAPLVVPTQDPLTPTNGRGTGPPKCWGVYDMAATCHGTEWTRGRRNG